jgi:endoglycosylceramidase
MLSHFANEPGVVGVEPINEPSPGSANPDTWESTTLPDFMARMIAHVAQKAPTTLVFVDPSGADGVDLSTTMTRPTGNFVFAPHFYPVANPSHTDQVQSLMQFWATLGSKWNVPVWVGEFGMDHGNVNALPWMTAHFAALDALGLSGTEWEYSVETQEWNSETDSIVAADGTEYPVTKAVLRPFARAVAGESVKQSWDPAAGKFTLTFTPASSGVTEISAPARAFPDGMNVTVTGGCYDATSVPGEVMVDGSGASGQLTVTLTSPVALSDGG